MAISRQDFEDAVAAYWREKNPAELVLLALAGLVIAVAGALAPAGWAARSSTAVALRAE